ncbi:hypothetical protein BJ741DRAFT_672146 [Chytriomyces cf. hyalinus JEL632]|nr:hypothetical protein BJ741DRAFT_672146 [Chytriomyces cf. hyalinus JEL632]
MDTLTGRKRKMISAAILRGVHLLLTVISYASALQQFLALKLFTLVCRAYRINSIASLLDLKRGSRTFHEVMAERKLGNLTAEKLTHKMLTFEQRVQVSNAIDHLPFSAMCSIVSSPCSSSWNSKSTVKKSASRCERRKSGLRLEITAD